MDLFKYFKWEVKCDCLPDSHGPLNAGKQTGSFEFNWGEQGR